MSILYAVKTTEVGGLWRARRYFFLKKQARADRATEILGVNWCQTDMGKIRPPCLAERYVASAHGDITIPKMGSDPPLLYILYGIPNWVGQPAVWRPPPPRALHLLTSRQRTAPSGLPSLIAPDAHECGGEWASDLWAVP